MLQLIFIVGFFIIIGMLVYVGMNRDRETDPLQEKLASYGDRSFDVESLEEVELSLSFKDRIIVPMVERLADITEKFTPQKQLEQSRRLIELSGQQQDPTQFFLQRIIFTIIGAGFGLFLGFKQFYSGSVATALLWTVGCTILGNNFPVLAIRSRISRRQQEIIKALPDALDLLVICVEAGLGFDQAIGKVYEKWDNELAIAFGRVLREIQLGKLRREALRDMANRMDVPDVNSFTAAIIQAEQLGVSMAKILRVQSDQMRVKRRQRAQEKAQQAPVKMMIPMVLLIFPSIWVVLMGPAVLKLMNTNTSGVF